MADTNEDEFVEIYATPEDAQATARALLDAADDPEHDVVSLGSGAFRVPKALAARADLPRGDEQGTKSVDDMTVKELEQYADDNNIDLEGAHLKADVLAAVKAGKPRQTDSSDGGDAGQDGE